MENPKLTPARAEQIVNLLRDNPGVEMTLGDIADETGLPVDELAAHLGRPPTTRRSRPGPKRAGGRR